MPPIRSEKDPAQIRNQAKTAWKRMKSCDLCPRNCGINRLQNEIGECGIGAKAVIISALPHYGEEAPLVGENGSGTIFFTGCNLHCVFCQNYEISHSPVGREMSGDQLAGVMLNLQKAGCHNINLVSPSHVVAQILSALAIAIEHGLHIPIVYNSGGYDTLSTLRLFEGIVDIYMPDFKFWNPESARTYMNAEDYPSVAREAILEMYRQVGDLVVDDNGIAKRGILLRHLVMHGCIEDTREIFHFLATQISPEIYVNIMDQYHPAGKASQYKEINRGLTEAEFQEAVWAAQEEGLVRFDPGAKISQEIGPSGKKSPKDERWKTTDLDATDCKSS